MVRARPAAAKVTALGPGTSRAIRPHRSGRTFAASAQALIAAIVGFIGTELLLAFADGRLVRSVVFFDARMLALIGTPTTVHSDAFLHMHLVALLFSMPSHRYTELLTWIGLCVLGIVLLSVFKPVHGPLRYFITFNLLIIASEATYLLFAGYLGYSTWDFSVLLLHTMLVTWLVTPFFVATIVALFPFRFLEGIALIVGCTVYVVVLEIVRYAVFIAILSRTGPILMSDLYLLYGPLLDVIPLVGIMALALTRLSMRMQTEMEMWRWL